MQFRLMSLVLIVSVGCAPPALITLRSGGTVSSPIVASDRDFVYVRGIYGQPQPVPRTQIVDIDHPGNVQIVAGLVGFALGMAVLSSDPSDSNNGNDQDVASAVGGAIADAIAQAMLVAVLFAAGTTLTIAGSVNYLWSYGASSNMQPPMPGSPGPVPHSVPLVPPPSSSLGLEFELGSHVRGVWGHLPTLRPRLEALLADAECSLNSPDGDIPIELCQRTVALEVTAAQVLARLGGTSIFAKSFDLGLYDRRHENFVINPDRVGKDYRICPWEAFAPTSRDQLLALVEWDHGGRTDKRRWGTMEVGVPGAAEGLWVTENDESVAVVLAPDRVTPSEKQVLSSAAIQMGAKLFSLPIDTGIARAGRIRPPGASATLRSR